MTLARALYSFAFSCILFLSLTLNAQKTGIYLYQDLSKFSFAKQKDSIKKNWECPKVYKEKATQKKYEEFWNGRTEFITSAIEANNYINDGDIYDYVYQIVSDLTKANPELVKQKQLLFIDRSASVNAYAVGGNIIAVNLGLITFCQSREEIALAIAHELSHNVLQHPENSMKDQAVFLTSDEYKNSLNAILDSKYDRLTKLKKVLEGYVFSRSKHSRYHESDADSLALVLLKNSHIAFDPTFFLRLDSADNEYKQPLNNSTKSYFASFNIPIDDAWFGKRGRGLSSRNYNFRDTSNISDSLKTHPDCVERYNNTKSRANLAGALTPLPKAVREKSNKMLLWNMYDNMNLTACLYRVFLQKDQGNTDPWYDFMIHNVMSGILYANKQLHRFNAIGIQPKEYISKNYYELQTMLEQVPAENLEQLYKASTANVPWSSLPPETRDLKTLMAAINLQEDDSDKKKSNAAKDFMVNNPTSMYCEFAEHFRK